MIVQTHNKVTHRRVKHKILNNSSLTKLHLPKLMVFALFIVLLILVQEASAIPPLPTEYYGIVRQFNFNATPGAIVTAFDNSGKQCGRFVVVNTGFYGSLTCSGDDPETTQDEGAVPFESISFRLNGGFTTLKGDNNWSPGKFKMVNITYPIVFCGDAFCDIEYENTFTCPFDCPPFNASSNATNVTSNGSANPPGGGGAGAGSEGTQSSTPSGRTSASAPATQYTQVTALESGFGGFECKEHWECSEWSICSLQGLQNRTCTDKNKCESFNDKPADIQRCVYTPTCADGLKNGLEDDIDCGGLCPPCIGCTDGVQNCHNDKCEEGIDCGGPCKPCATCFDSLKNCPGEACEDGVDCGGPCEKQCPVQQRPLPVFVCSKDVDLFSSHLLAFLIVMVVSIASNVAYHELSIHKLRHSGKLKGIERAKRIYSSRRKEMVFSAIMLIVSAVLFSYYYMFVLCEAGLSNLWLLIILLSLSPLLIHYLIKFLEYDEQKKVKKLISVEGLHQQQINKLKMMQHEGVIELLKNAKAELDKLISASESSSQALGVNERARVLASKLPLVISNYSQVEVTEQTLKDEAEFVALAKSFIECEEFIRLSKQIADLFNVCVALASVVMVLEERKKLYLSGEKTSTQEKTEQA
jgi:hypothetical protein